MLLEFVSQSFLFWGLGWVGGDMVLIGECPGYPQDAHIDTQ
jgi:hypothetical protein